MLPILEAFRLILQVSKNIVWKIAAVFVINEKGLYFDEPSHQKNLLNVEFLAFCKSSESFTKSEH